MSDKEIDRLRKAEIKSIYMRGWLWATVISLILIIFFCSREVLADKISGPVKMEVTSVYDGDTFSGTATPWPNISIRVSVRVRGVDTPEIGWRAKCPKEKRLGDIAREFTKESVSGGVLLYDIGEDKYGRTLARVETNRGWDLAEALITAGLGRGYHGRR